MQQEDDEMQVFLFVVKVVSSQVVCVMCYGWQVQQVESSMQ